VPCLSVNNIFVIKYKTILHTPIPTLQLMNKWSTTLRDSLSAVQHDPDVSLNWTRRFMLATCVLASPAAGHRLRWQEIVKLVRSHLDRWVSGDIEALWLDAMANTRKLQNTIQQIQALSSRDLADPSPEVL